MRAAHLHFNAPNGKTLLLSYSSKAAKSLLVCVFDTNANATYPLEETEEEMTRMRLASGWARTFQDSVDVRFNEKALTVITPEWTITIENHVKPGIVGATTCATGKCFINVQIVPNFNADKAKVAPHGLVGQSYDGDDYGVI